jgi:peptide/nickel transport system permease protein
VARLIARYASLTVALLLLYFLLPRALPGDPLDVQSSDLAGTGPALTQAQRASLRATYHLDQPPPAQLLAYLDDLAHADLGWSISRDRPVVELIAERLPWTAGLVASSLLVACLAGVLLGTLTAWHANRLGPLAAALLAGVPEFLLAIGLLLVFAVGLRWLPLQGGRTPFLAGGPLTGALDVLAHLALPAIALSLTNAAPFLLLAHGTVAGELQAAYVRTARGKGLAERTIALRHTLPNAAGPLATAIAIRLGQVFGGAIVVERIFGIPGLGLLTVESLRARDYPVLQAVLLLTSLGVLLALLLVELAQRGLERRRATLD